MNDERVDLIILGILGVAAGLTFAGLGYLTREVHEVTWGLFVPGYVYFALVSIGASIIGSIYTVFGYKGDKGTLPKFVKLSTWFSFATIIPAWVLIILDLTRPTRFYLIYLSFNPESRIAWMAAFYGGFALFLLLELLYFIRAEVSERLAKMKTLELFIAVMVLILELGLAGNLAQVFGTLTSIPLWYGTHMAFLFISLAILLGVSGLSLMLTPFARESADRKLFVGLYGKVMLVSTLVVTYVFIWMFLTTWYNPVSFAIAKQMLTGRFSELFWLGTVFVGLVIPLAGSIISLKMGSITSLRIGAVAALAGGLITVSSIIIVPQTVLVEVLGGYALKSYHLNFSDMLGLTGALVLWPFLYLLGIQLLSVMPGERPKRLFIFK